MIKKAIYTVSIVSIFGLSSVAFAGGSAELLELLELPIPPEPPIPSFAHINEQDPNVSAYNACVYDKLDEVFRRGERPESKRDWEKMDKKINADCLEKMEKVFSFLYGNISSQEENNYMRDLKEYIALKDQIGEVKRTFFLEEQARQAQEDQANRIDRPGPNGYPGGAAAEAKAAKALR